MKQPSIGLGLLDTIETCSSWRDFQARMRPLSDKQKGDTFEHLVKAFLCLEPEYASKLKHVWLFREVPQAVAEKLRLPPADQGIDLVAETKGGSFWAIQCKYRDHTDASLTWRDVSTFAGLSFGVCRAIKFGLICSTTERFTNVLKYQDRIGFCALDVWQALGPDFFGRLRAHVARKPDLLESLKPRPHQREAVQAGYQHFVVKRARRGKLIMPCGSGKSLTAYWIAQKLKSRRIVVAVPSLALIRQTLKVWLRETVANRALVEWICVCSDESAGHIERDDVTVLRQDLGVPCLTNPGEIAAWLKRKHALLTVVFTTYQSGEALGKAARAAKFRFDLGIMDEAHRTVGAREKLFSYMLHDANLPIRRRLFMTATERRYAGQSDEVLSMDNPDVYGETFHLLSFKHALDYAPPILSNYRILNILVTREEVADLIRRKVFLRPHHSSWDKEIEADMLASLIALRKAMKKYPIRHAVSFHSSIQRAELFKIHNHTFTRALPSYGNVESFHVSGRTPTGTRARLVDDFTTSKRALITNARCLTEGVDVPSIDCVLFADPRRSKVDIVQAVGRALRPASGKRMGYVLLPILHSADAKPEDLFESDSFKELLATLRALAATDDRIIDYFRAVSQGRRIQPDGSFEVDLDERLAERIDLAQFARDIELKCWTQLGRLSWRPFQEARAFAHTLKFKGQSEWFAFCTGKKLASGRLPADIPAAPQIVYRNTGWKTWGDWLGTGTVAPYLRNFRAFHEARDFARQLQLRSQSQWYAFARGEDPKRGILPQDIPTTPSGVYAKKGWEGWGDWLGTGAIAPKLRKYRSFRAARAFTRKLNLKSTSEWISFTQGRLQRLGHLPRDIPAYPAQTYAKNGWKGMGDWLGTGRIADNLKEYRSFREARTFARQLGLKTGAEWKAFCDNGFPHLGQLPCDIPAAPWGTYAETGWTTMGDWLGSGSISNRDKVFRPFRKARAFARKLKLRNEHEWRAFCRGETPQLGHRPPGVPACPARTYAGRGWRGMRDWLGIDNGPVHRRNYRIFKNARAFARQLRLKNQLQWFEFCKGNVPNKGKLPNDIPCSPDRIYRDKGWRGYGDWLGTGRIASRLKRYRRFSQARAFARRLKLRNENQWHAFCKGQLPKRGRLPSDIPACPSQTYADRGWKGMGDWLGTGTIANFLRVYRPFTKARAFARKLKLRNELEWRAFCKGKMPQLGKRPPDIPACPAETYARRGWKGIGDWLGTGHVAFSRMQWRSFVKARAFARNLRLKSSTEWFSFCRGNIGLKGRLPKDIPVAPHGPYASKGWRGYGDWLGTGTVANRLKQYRPFRKARTFAHALKLNSRAEWQAYCKGEIPDLKPLPSDIPAYPCQTYADQGWRGFRDWLGTAPPVRGNRRSLPASKRPHLYRRYR